MDGQITCFIRTRGRVFRAHQFLFSGTSAASASDDAAGVFAAENMSRSGISGNTAIAGCIANSNTVVQLMRPPETETEGALNFADARATTDLGLFFDLTKQPRSFNVIAAPKSAAFFLKDKRKMLDPDDQ